MTAIAFCLQLGVLLMSLLLELNPKIKKGPVESAILCALSLAALARMGCPVDPLELALTAGVFAVLIACLLERRTTHAASSPFDAKRRTSSIH